MFTSGDWARRAQALRREFSKLSDLLQGDHAQLTPSQGAGDDGLVLIVTMLRRVGPLGVNTHIAQAADQLAQQGQRVQVVSLDSWLPWLGPILLAPSLLIRRTRFTRGISLDLYLTRRSLQLSIRRQIKLEKPTVIYAQDPRSAYAALRARGNSGIPVVMVVHYNESEAEELVNRHLIAPGGRRDRAIRTFEATVIPQLDGLVFVSEFMRHYVQTAIPQARGVPSAIIPNFLRDLEPPPVGGVSRDCISVGYLVERKNHPYLLRVLAATRRQGHRYTLTLVGDGPERGFLERLASELGVADQVSFLGERFDVDQLLRQHRVYVHSSLMENCPFALLEAFRAGLPVITSPVGGIPEVVGGDGAGRFWDLTDPIAGARVLTELLEDEAARADAARQARARFETSYDAVVVGDQLAGFLRSVQGQVSGPWCQRS